MYKEMEIALKALQEIEEGFRFSVHGNATCYHIAKTALDEIEKIRNRRADHFTKETQ